MCISISDYEKIVSIDKLCDDRIKEITEEQIVINKRVEKSNRVFLIIVLVVLLVLSVVFGLVAGKTFLAHDIYGANTICYTTISGDCYHSLSCGSLWNSCNKTTVYEARKRGLSECSKCSVGELDVTKKEECFKGIIICLAIFIPIPIWLLLFLQNKRILKIKQSQKDKKKQLEREYAKRILSIINNNGLLQIVGAPSDVILEDGIISSNNEDYFRYISDYGRCYHSNPKCSSRMLHRVLAYSVCNLYPCSKCAKKIEVPEWYKQLIIAYKIQKRCERMTKEE